MATDVTSWWGWAMLAVVCAPWLAGITYYWRRRPRDGSIPPSMGEMARRWFRVS